jgi:localization factor PodJL
VSVQSELARRGYYSGSVDGVIGPSSRQAIRAFQAAQGLPVTGIIDAKLLKALGISYRTA